MSEHLSKAGRSRSVKVKDWILRKEVELVSTPVRELRMIYNT